MTTATRSDLQTDSTPDLGELRKRIEGDVLTAESDQYDSARELHSIIYDRRPLAIVRVAGPADVAEAVRFGVANRLPIAVRSGGHSVPGYSGVDDGIVIDFTRFNKVFVDPGTQTARVQPGATSNDLANAAQEYGLALSTGDTRTVGFGGLATGGGIGWLVRKHGLAIDNLLSVQVVTADGGIVRASATENPDLFWAVRGGGGNFGIITEFQFRLARVGTVLAGAIALPATREVIRGYLDYMAIAPEGLSTISHVMHAPPAPFIPEDRIGELTFMIFTVYTGDDLDEGQRVVDNLRALGPVMADTVEAVPYPVIYVYMDEAAKRHGAAVRSMFSYDLSDAAIDSIIAHMEVASSPMAMIQIRTLGGAMARVPAEATAFPHRDKKVMTTVLGLWMDPEDDGAAHFAWAERAWADIRPEGDGVYVNFLDDEGNSRIRQAYQANYRRLAQVKRRWDPDNVFQLNQNVRPAA